MPQHYLSIDDGRKFAAQPSAYSVKSVSSDLTMQGGLPLTTSRRYVLISPCRDEEMFARRTLESVVRQRELPVLWVIVDDGSTDATPNILEEYAARHPFIRVLHQPDRGERKVGAGVVEAFERGLASVNLGSVEYLCKLDLDVDLPATYFAELMDRMEADPRLGTCSGKPYYPGRKNVKKTFDGKLIPENCGDEISVGMTKFYRVACFGQLGGFVKEVMWDGIDCHRCRILGWKVRSWRDPSLRFIHLRPMGSSQNGLLAGRIRHGFGQYFMGTGFIYLAASAISRATSRPFVVGSLGMLWGYLLALAKRKPRYGDGEFRRFLKSYQRSCLLIGKAAATRRVEREFS